MRRFRRYIDTLRIQLQECLRDVVDKRPASGKVEGAIRGLAIGAFRQFSKKETKMDSNSSQ